MTDRRDQATGPLTRLLLIGLAVAAMVGLIAGLAFTAIPHIEERSPTENVVIVAAPAPIPAEAGVFRSAAVNGPGSSIGTGGDLLRRAAARPRTLSRFRANRAYPGAPPRIPHALTRTELRTTTCTVCHERGGYSPRFLAYVPRTPHPELTDCLQCHMPDAHLAGVALPANEANDICRQCHALGTGRNLPVTHRAWGDVDWRPAPWPPLDPVRASGTPPPIPHDLDLRGNCGTCHVGQSAIAEIRTAHPERSNCRQCHMAPSAADSVYTRTPRAPADTMTGMP